MKYAVTDTEGSGLFRYKDENGVSVPADAPGQPRLAEIVMIFVDEKLEIEREYQAYIKPEGWEMTAGATEANGLTTEFLLEKGIPVVEALAVYTAAIEAGYVIVAHNAQHDCKQIRAELRRAGMDDLFEQTKNVCTMRGLMKVVPSTTGKAKWPKLEEACAHFGIPHEGKHTATGDAHGCLGLLRKMLELDCCPEPKVHYAKKPAPGKEAAPADGEGEGKARNVPF